VPGNALDAMGGDFAPDVPVAGAVEALRDLPSTCEILLVSRRKAIEQALRQHRAPRDRLRIVEAREVIEMAEKPLAAVRGKRLENAIRVAGQSIDANLVRYIGDEPAGGMAA